MDANTALEHLQAAQQLTILDLSYPILHPEGTDAQKCDSTTSEEDASAATTSPALLAADLAHYQDLFSKLRFSYVEQVTKERFLRSIVADPPEFVDAAENAELEERLRAEKEVLRVKKEEVRALVREMEGQGRALAERYEMIQLQTAQLESLPEEIENLQSTISTLRSQQVDESSNSNNPSLSLPLQPTLELLSTREQELSEIDEQIAALQESLPAKRQRVEQLHDELTPLQARKIRAVQEAQDARRRREVGGISGDELEERGRWLRGVEQSMKSMLEV